MFRELPSLTPGTLRRGMATTQDLAHTSAWTQTQKLLLAVLSGVIFMPLFYWIAGAPARELRGRAPVGPARTKDEMRAIYLKNISYGKILAIALLGLSTPLARRNLWPENVAWHRWSWAIAIAILLVATVVAVRKFRFESAHRNSQA